MMDADVKVDVNVRVVGQVRRGSVLVIDQAQLPEDDAARESFVEQIEKGVNDACGHRQWVLVVAPAGSMLEVLTPEQTARLRDVLNALT